MDELNFLLTDSNILEAEIADIVDAEGEETQGIVITVGMNDSQITSLLDLVGPEKVSKIPTAFEIALTKNDLERINELIKKY